MGLRTQARKHARERRARALAKEEESKRELQAVQAELIKAEVDFAPGRGVRRRNEDVPEKFVVNDVLQSFKHDFEFSR